MTPLCSALTAARALVVPSSHTAEELEQAALATEEIAEAIREEQRRIRASSSTLERVRQLAAQGFDDTRIAAQLGIRRDYVARLRGQAKISAAKPRGEDRTPWRRVMAELLERGASVQEIAEATGVSVRTAANRCAILRREARAGGGLSKRKAKG